MTLVVLCAGGHARVVIEALRSRGLQPDAVTDRNAGRKGELIGGISIVGSDDVVLTMPAAETRLVIGLGNAASRLSSGLTGRRDMFERFASLGFAFPVVSHATAVMASDVTPGEGAQIMAGAIVQPGARIGRNVLINSRALVEHDCEVGDHTHIAPAAVLCGGVVVGAEVHVGAGAVVLGGIKLGAGCIVAAGAVIAKDVEPGAFAGGRDRI
jgi:sugar O-acyltransferase (sialic acid O-acetyltransferase NeuD family)